MDFYIVGFPRSGTTLLTNRLNESLLVAIPPETRFYAEFGYKKTLNLKVKQLLKAERMKDVISSETKLKPTDIVKGSSSEILTKLILNWAEEKKIKYDLVGEKSPVHQLFLPKILKNEDAKMKLLKRNQFYWAYSI